MRPRSYARRGFLMGAASAALRGAEDEQYIVPGSFPLIQQEGDTCWAAVATMMYNWRHSSSATADEVTRMLGQDFHSLYRDRRELPANDWKERLLAKAGLVSEAPQNFTPKGWMWLLKEFGLLWVTTSPWEEAPFSTHARIIRGAKMGGVSGLTLRVIDPLEGREQHETFAEMLNAFERLAITQNRSTPDRDLVSQVFHHRKGRRPD